MEGKMNLKQVMPWVTFIGVLWGGFITVDQSYVKAEEHKKLNRRVSLLELKTRHGQALDDYYQNKNLFKKYPLDKEVIEAYERSRARVTEIETEMQTLKRSPASN